MSIFLKKTPKSSKIIPHKHAPHNICIVHKQTVQNLIHMKNINKSSFWAKIHSMKNGIKPNENLNWALSPFSFEIFLLKTAHDNSNKIFRWDLSWVVSLSTWLETFRSSLKLNNIQRQKYQLKPFQYRQYSNNRAMQYLDWIETNTWPNENLKWRSVLKLSQNQHKRPNELQRLNVVRLLNWTAEAAYKMN